MNGCTGRSYLARSSAEDGGFALQPGELREQAVDDA